MNKITNEHLDSLIKSAVNSSGPLPPDEKFAQIISALRELRELRAAMLQGAEPVSTDYTLPADVRGAINRLLDSDGSRGTFSAVRSYDAREELERLLAASPQQEV